MTALRKGPARRTAAYVVIALGIILGLGWVIARGRGKSAAVSPQAANAPVASSTMAGMAGMGGASDGSVTLTSTQLRDFGVTFDTVEMRPLSKDIRTAGSVIADETRMATIAPKFSGYVERLYANFTGQPVRRGQPLAEIFSPDLIAAEQELLVAAKLAPALGNSTIPGTESGRVDLVASAKRRLKLWDVSDAEIASVLRTGRPMRTVTLYAPVAGIVTDKKVVQGQAVQAGQELYTIADLTSVWIEAELREADAGGIAAGTPASIALTAFPGRPLEGRVSYVYPVLAGETRTIKARIALPNPGGRLKPGMFATVTLHTSSGSALTVSHSAVIQTGEKSIVFVEVAPGKLIPRTVVVGRRGSNYVEIISGLSPGQRVVTSAQFLIDSEANLAELMRGMADTGR